MDEIIRNRALRAKTLGKFFQILQEQADASYDWLRTYLNQELMFEGGRDDAGYKLKPGMKLMVVGYIGAGGSYYLASQREDELRTQIHPQVIRRGKVSLPPTIPKELGKFVYYPIVEGGFLNSLNHLAKDYKKGFYVELKKVPIRQETIEYCEFFKVHPYELFSGGSYLVATDHPRDLHQICSSYGLICKAVGLLREKPEKIIAHGGEESLLNRTKEDALLTILKKDL